MWLRLRHMLIDNRNKSAAFFRTLLETIIQSLQFVSRVEEARVHRLEMSFRDIK